jgi:hypothetical protein
VNWFKRKPASVYPPPVTILEANVDPLESAMDLALAINAHRDAQAQAAQAAQAVARLRASRLRNGFAPVIEDSIIRRYLGSTP